MQQKMPYNRMVCLGYEGSKSGVWVKFNYWRDKASEPRQLEYFFTVAQLRLLVECQEYALDRELQDELPFA